MSNQSKRTARIKTVRYSIWTEVDGKFIPEHPATPGQRCHLVAFINEREILFVESWSVPKLRRDVPPMARRVRTE